MVLNLMEELGIECRVGHPAEIRAAEPRKQKHDRRDADLILKLLMADRFPAIWLPSFLRGSQTSTCATRGLSRSCNQAAQVPSSKVTCKLPRSPWTNRRIVTAFVSRMASITSLPGKIQN